MPGRRLGGDARCLTADKENRPLPPRFTSLIVAGVMATAACSTARADCAAFNALVGRTYGFKPSALDAAHQKAKVTAMDSVWAAVHKNKADLVPCLRTAIETRTNDPYFQFDAGMLL